jgi:uncharacterized protein YkwD
LQRIATSLIAVLTILTFVGANMQALLWQSSDWLVSTVLPAVVVDLTNDQRTDLAATPLRRSVALDAAATQKAQHMVANEYFAHFAPDGTSPWHFFDEAGYVYAHAGENLAIHFSDSSEVVDAWMNSPAHRENIANRTFTEIGVGTAKGTFDGYDTVFVVQLFGTPAVPPPAIVVPEPVIPVVPTQVPTDTQDTILSDLRAELEVLQTQADTLAALSESTVQDTPDVVVTDVLPAPQAVLSTTPADNLLPVRFDPPVFSSRDTVVVETQLSTSSGLAVASIIEPATNVSSHTHAGATIASVVTRPNLVLDMVYSLLLSAILVLLALFGEAKRLHYMQAAYSLLLIAGVGGLWFAHTLLTSGAVII